MFGKGMIKKVLMYIMLGPIGMLLGGGFNIMDFLMIPMIAGMIGPMFKGLGLNIPGFGGGVATATAGT
jgi:hypothetical protein